MQRASGISSRQARAIENNFRAANRQLDGIGRSMAGAIMPLRRTANGDLGFIAAAGRQAPQNVTINVQIDGGAGDQHMQDLVRAGVAQGMAEVQKQIVPTVREGLRRGSF